ncbi:MAG: TfoX family protein [Acidobacteria bacterium]|nr:TfoX family protein [Acidobacteriota bacterium]
MAFDPVLADLVRVAIGEHTQVVEMKMFGGIAFMLGGHMCCGIVKDRLMLRVSPHEYDAMLERPGVNPMEFTGRPMRGFVFVDAAETATVSTVRKWLKPSIAFASSLPAKANKPKKTKTARKK